MKRLITLLLASAMLMTMAFTSCSNEKDDTNDNSGDAAETTVAEETTPDVELPYKNSLELADQILSKFDPEKAPPAGTMDIDFTVEGYDYTLTDLGLPTDLHTKIDNAAALRHMMMVNQFSAGVYHFTSAEDIDSAVEAIKKSIMEKEWMCGFPEKLIVITLPGNYVISAYGMGGLDPDPNFAVDYMTPFIDAINAVIEGAVVVVDEPLM